jgi:hypothetical protein
VPDMTGDGKNDLVGRVAGTSSLWIYPGRGNGGFLRRKRISSSWDGYGLTAGVGDLDDDGHNDLVARQGRRLYLIAGPARRLRAPVALPGRWGAYSIVSGAGDLTNDGKADVLVKERKTGRVFIFPGNAQGRFAHRIGPFAKYKNLNYLAGFGSLPGDSSTDLIGRNGAGRMLVYPNNGNRNIARITRTAVRINKANLILNIGDWNGDGHGDFMVRNARGALLLRTGNGSGGFGAPSVAADGWRKVRLVAAVGDITGDGHPDLMGQPEGMAMRIYPGDGARGFLPSYVAHSAITANRHTGVGLWDGDGSPDSLVRRGNGALVLYRGNGPGGLMNPTQVAKGAKRYDWLRSVGDATGDGRPDVMARERSTGKLWLLPGTKKGFGARRLVAPQFGRFDLSS